MRDPIVRIKIIQKKISLINTIINNYSGNILLALSDEVMARPAVLMHLVAISEQINKLKEDNAFAILEKFNPEDLRGVGDMRNFIAHDYEGVDLKIVEQALLFGLPGLQTSIDEIIKRIGDIWLNSGRLQ